MQQAPKLRIGDHIRVLRGFYYHHGIYVGHGWIVHFTSTAKRLQDAIIRYDSLARFLHHGSIDVVEYARSFDAEEVVRRAQSRLGDNGYDLFGNNCEHFARWCKTGQQHSQQVHQAAAGAAGIGGGAGLTAGALGVVSASGAAAGLSGAGVMSGLAAAGLGTGVVGGLGLLATGPAAVTTVAMHHALQDDPHLPTAERAARQAARTSTVVGAAAGTVGSIAAVSAAGSVAGLSAAGITSGLAAIGSTVGGGMVAGVALTIAAPAAIAAAAGYVVYRCMKPRS